jgi:hypothetical protein
MTKEIIHLHVYDPEAFNIFGKGKKSDLASVHTIECEFKECPLKAQGFCICRNNILRPHKCYYGSNITENSPSRRSKSYRQWLQVKKTLDQEYNRYLNAPPEKLAYIKDYVYLPYSFMNMNKKINFNSHGGLFNNGDSLLHKDNWGIETLLQIVDFIPRAIFDYSEIKDYQQKIIPLFVMHLKEIDLELYKELIKERPKLDVTPNFVGRKAYLNTLNYPFEYNTRKDEYNVHIKYDGKTLKTNSLYAFEPTWSEISRNKIKELDICVIPEDDYVIVIQDNSWVNNNTKFLD